MSRTKLGKVIMLGVQKNINFFLFLNRQVLCIRLYCTQRTLKDSLILIDGSDVSNWTSGNGSTSSDIVKNSASGCFII